MSKIFNCKFSLFFHLFISMWKATSICWSIFKIQSLTKQWNELIEDQAKEIKELKAVVHNNKPKDDSYVQIKASDLNDICEIAKSLMKFADGDSVTEDRAYNILVKAQQPLQERDPQNI